MNTNEIDEQRTNPVVKGNDLIQKTTFNLTATEQKFIAYVISLIKATDKELQFYNIRVRDFAELTGINTKNAYQEFKDMAVSLDSKSAWITIDDDKKVSFMFRWFSEAKYCEKEGYIKVLLNSEIKKYLLDLINKGNYTQYELYNILGLKSKYSIRLYEVLRSYAYRGSAEYDVDRLKEILAAETYKSFSHFKDRVIDKALSEINGHTDLNVTFITVDTKGNEVTSSQGKKVSAVRFHIEKKDIKDKFYVYQKTVESINNRNKQIKGQLQFDESGNIYEA